MKKNMGSTDRIIRAILGVLFGAFYFMGYVTGIMGIILLVLATIFILTSLFGFCPLYVVLGLNSGSSKKSSV